MDLPCGTGTVHCKGIRSPKGSRRFSVAESDHHNKELASFRITVELKNNIKSTRTQKQNQYENSLATFLEEYYCKENYKVFQLSLTFQYDKQQERIARIQHVSKKFLNTTCSLGVMRHSG